MKKETEYQIGIDWSKGEDHSYVCLRKGKRIVVLKPKDYKREGDGIILKKNPEFYFKGKET